MGYDKKHFMIELAECYSEGLSQKEIADELGLSIFQIKRGISSLKANYPKLYISAYKKRSLSNKQKVK